MARPRQPRRPEIPAIVEPEQLDSSDLLRLASTDERFARALLENPDSFARPFNLSAIEIDAIRRIPIDADLGTSFDYDA